MNVFKPGEKIGKYKIVEVIGRGGMATVFRGVDEDLDRPVAIKVLHPHLENRDEAKERFRREARAIAKISHPNIVEIFDYSGEESETSYIVTQLVSGGNLKELYETHNPFPPEIAAAVALQIAEGLEVAHRAGVVHRDVKPENLLLDKNGIIKIADFGIAHLKDAGNMTATGQILGSPYYMSPEQILGGPIDEKADIFSFGSLLFWLLTGKIAFEGPNPHAILRNIVEKEAGDLERLAPAAGEDMAQIVKRCLAKNPHERINSLSEIVSFLKDYLKISEVEDPRKELKEFIENPEKYREERKKKSITIWTEKAVRLNRNGAIQEAMNLFNRILALDPENSEVLRFLKKVESARVRRKAVRWCASVAVSIAIFATAFWAGATLLSGRPGERNLITQSEKKPNAQKPSNKNLEIPGNQEKQESSENINNNNTGNIIKKKTLNPRALKENNPNWIKLLKGEKIREVRFAPKPKTVDIYVDGKLLGSYFDYQFTTLPVGEHIIRFEPKDKECCEPAEKKVKVYPPKSENEPPQIIGMSLSFKPASLIVFSNKPAEILINGTKMGRTGEFIEIPLDAEPSKTVTLTASANGCQTWKKEVTIRAGKKTNINADLSCNQ